MIRNNKRKPGTINTTPANKWMEYKNENDNFYHQSSLQKDKSDIKYNTQSRKDYSIGENGTLEMIEQDIVELDFRNSNLSDIET